MASAPYCRVSSDPMPNGNSWLKISAEHYVDGSGRFAISRVQTDAGKQKGALWTIKDKRTGKSRGVGTLRIAKGEVRRTLFEEEWARDEQRTGT